MRTPINDGLLQSDLDCAGFDLINFTGGGGGTGHGIPAGGTTGQLLKKLSTTDYDANWSTVSTGGGGGLDANTVTAGDIGLVGDGVTDNTAALQAWLDSVGVAKVNSTLLVPDGIYIFSGPLQDTGRKNAQILLPASDITDPAYSVTIKGYHGLGYIPWPLASIPSSKGPVFRSTLSTGGGSQPAFISGMGSVSSPITANVGFNLIRFENMIFQTVSNPHISCLNLSHYGVVELAGDVLIMAGTGLGSNDMVQPTTVGSYGLILAPNSTSFHNRIENLNVTNFYTGVFMGEVTHVSNLGVLWCYYALEFPFAYHMSVIDRMVDYWCKYGARVTGAHTFQINQFDIERPNDGAWWMRVYDIDDPSNLATADVAWWTIIGGVGTSNTFTINGGAGVQARRVGFGPSVAYIGTDARLTAISGGAKLEVRNTGTGVWMEAARWTNP